MVSAARIGGVFCVAMLFGACATGAPSDYAKGSGASEAGTPSGDGRGSGSNDKGGGKGGSGGKSGSGGKAGAADAGDGSVGSGKDASQDAAGPEPVMDGGVPPEDAATPDSCSDKVKGTGETGTDCGGDCPPCDNDQGCLVPADCGSLYCSASGICGDPPLPSCSDKMKNALETDIDCGGGSCAACIIGKTCSAPSDCASDACTASKCVCKVKTMAEACGTRVCGGASDGCSATISCGTCGSGQTCDGTGTCVTTPACVASACGACGIVQTKCCKTATACGCAYPFAPCL